MSIGTPWPRDRGPAHRWGMTAKPKAPVTTKPPTAFLTPNDRRAAAAAARVLANPLHAAPPGWASWPYAELQKHGHTKAAELGMRGALQCEVIPPPAGDTALWMATHTLKAEPDARRAVLAELIKVEYDARGPYQGQADRDRLCTYLAMRMLEGEPDATELASRAVAIIDEYATAFRPSDAIISSLVQGADRARTPFPGEAAEAGVARAEAYVATLLKSVLFVGPGIP